MRYDIIKTNPEVSVLLDKFHNTITFSGRGSIRYGKIGLYSYSGIGGGNDIHYDYQVKGIEVFLCGLPFSIYKKRRKHNGTFVTEKLRLRLFARYRKTIEQAIEQADTLFKEKEQLLMYIARKKIAKNQDKVGRILAKW